MHARCFRLRFRPLLALSLGLLASSAAAQNAVNRRFKETDLGPFPKEAQETCVISGDSRHVAYPVTTAAGMAVRLDGSDQKTYAKVDALTFSPDGKSLAYAASASGKWAIVRDGKPGPGFQRVGPPVFGPDGKRLAYVGLEADNGRVVMIDGHPSQAYDEIFHGLVVFSPDGKHVAYGARTPAGWRVVIDGREGPAGEYLGSATGIVFSPDSTRVAYTIKKGPHWSLAVNGQPQAACDDTAEAVFSPDSQRLAYVAKKDGKWRVVVDGAEQKPYDAIGEGLLQFSPDSKNLAYAAQSGAKWTVVYNGREAKPYDGIADMTFSPNGKFLGYLVKSETAMMAVINNREQPLYDKLARRSLVFSRNSLRVGYVAKVGRASFVVIGALDAADEKAKAKAAEGRMKRKKRYELVGYLNFTLDNDHYAYVAVSGGKVFTVVDDLEAVNRYDSIWYAHGQRLAFDGFGKTHYLGVKEGKIYLVEEEI